DVVYKGKGKVFFDPDDGTWKDKGPFENLGLTLEDYGASKILSTIQAQYPPIDLKKRYAVLLQKEKKKSDSIMRAEMRAQAIKDSIEYQEKYPEQKTFPDSSFYKGHLLDGKRHGYGQWRTKAGSVYEGFWADDKKNGKGRMDYKDGSSYEGDWKDDKIEGYGTVTWANGRKYIGYLVNSQRHGQGIQYRADGTKIEEGNYSNGYLQQGICFDSLEREIYNGECKDGKYEGRGKYTYYSEDGRTNVTTGEWKNDEAYNGSCIITEPNGTIYLREIINGKWGKPKKQETNSNQ
ncbi:MAG: hypothetical protein FJY10_11530, partial [Bacteroidetes bacterium]|nr:hypothetical protein [Bacteroidota bacterium]